MGVVSIDLSEERHMLSAPWKLVVRADAIQGFAKVTAYHRDGQPVRLAGDEYAVPVLPCTPFVLRVIEKHEYIDGLYQIEVSSPGKICGLHDLASHREPLSRRRVHSSARMDQRRWLSKRPARRIDSRSIPSSTNPASRYRRSAALLPKRV